MVILVDGKIRKELFIHPGTCCVVAKREAANLGPYFNQCMYMYMEGWFVYVTGLVPFFVRSFHTLSACVLHTCIFMRMYHSSNQAH